MIIHILGKPTANQIPSREGISVISLSQTQRKKIEEEAEREKETNRAGDEEGGTEERGDGCHLLRAF